MGSQNRQIPAKKEDDEYFSDFFDDDLFLVEAMDPEDFQVNISAVSQEVCDVLNISDETWQEDFSYYNG